MVALRHEVRKANDRHLDLAPSPLLSLWPNIVFLFDASRREPEVQKPRPNALCLIIRNREGAHEMGDGYIGGKSNDDEKIVRLLECKGGKGQP